MMVTDRKMPKASYRVVFMGGFTVNIDRYHHHDAFNQKTVRVEVQEYPKGPGNVVWLTENESGRLGDMLKAVNT